MSIPSKTRSKSGTRTWKAKNPVTAAEVCRIIEVCRQAGITSLKWSDLEFSFGVSQPEVEIKAKPVLYDTDEPKSEQPKDTPPATEPPALSAAELDQLMIESPAEYEAYMMTQEPENVGQQ